MGKLQKIFYLLFTLSFVPTLQAQDSLYFFQYPGQRYLTMRDITHTEMGDTTDFQRYIDLGEVVQQQYVNGKQYYYHPFFSAPMAYAAGKIYWLDGNTEKLFADFTVPSGSTFTGTIPRSTQSTLTFTKTVNTYRVSDWQYSFYFTKNFGISRMIRTYSYLPPLPEWITIEMNVKEMKYRKEDGSYFLFQTPLTVSTGVVIVDTLFTPSVTLKVSSQHPYSGIYRLAVDFWDTVKANFVYSKLDVDNITISHRIPRKTKEVFEATLPLEETLLRSGYRLHVYFTLTDKSLGPNVFRYPTEGFREIHYLMKSPDFYIIQPDFKNFYNKWLISSDGLDTSLVGEVEHHFMMDTMVNSTLYKREKLFSDTLYFLTNDSNQSFNFFRRLGTGWMSPVGTDTLLFSSSVPRLLHYIDSGTGVRYQGDFFDTLAGVESRLYHFKGGMNGDEELKFKIGTGPVLIVRYEPDGMGILNKMFYRLVRVDNHGIITQLEEPRKSDPTVTSPTEFSISNNYPNPFNPSTKVRIATVENSVLTFTLFNSNGEEVSSYTKEYTAKGNYEEEINLSGFPSGAWFLSVRDENGKQIKLLKLLYLK